MTLIYESDPDILTTYLHTKTGLSRSRLSKVKSPNTTERQTYSATERITTSQAAPFTSINYIKNAIKLKPESSDDINCGEIIGA